MEDELQPEPRTETPKQAPAPVMDVTPPPQAADSRLHHLPKDQITTPSADKQTTATPDKPEQVSSKKSRKGVGLAITATVIIVLGLAVLATYAYLKTIR